jgi:hypothetical protein
LFSDFEESISDSSSDMNDEQIKTANEVEQIINEEEIFSECDNNNNNNNNNNNK